jgi:hypothetical protein
VKESKVFQRIKKGLLYFWLIVGTLSFILFFIVSVDYYDYTTSVEESINRAQSVLDERDRLKEQVKSLQSELEATKAELQSMKDKEAAEAAAKAQVVEKTLGTGTFYVGEDIAAGRYIVSSPDSSGNFAVFGSDGYARVSEILGTEQGFAVNNITIDLMDGETIEISGLSSVTFKPKQ